MPLGDIVLVTDNPQFLAGSNKDHPIITYDKGLAKPAKMTVRNITDTVIKGFGTGVGGFSNAATCMYAMAAIFKPDDPRRAELLRRIKLEREIVGQEIDRIKGADKPYLPTRWKRHEPIPDPAAHSPEEVREAYRRNSTVISKKPYFFRYLYPELDALHRKFESSYDKASLAMFGVRFKRLLATPRAQRAPDQDGLVRRYEKYSPLITAPCAMNLLCRAVESEDFDLRFGGAAKARGTMLPRYPGIDLPPAKAEAARAAYREWSRRRRSKALAAAISAAGADPGDAAFADARAEALDAMMADVRGILSSAGVLPPELLRACSVMESERKGFDWAFAWDALDSAILPLIPPGAAMAPEPDPEGPIEYLGARYSPVPASPQADMSVERLMRALFGDYDGLGPAGGWEGSE